MHARRFFCPGNLDSPPWRLPPDEARHARKVLRLNTGDHITLLDGRGGAVLARLSALNDLEAVAEPVGAVTQAPLPGMRPWLLIGSPDPSSLDEVVAHAAELGAWGLLFFPAARSQVVHLALLKREERWRTLLRGSVKQSGNLFLPELRTAANLEEALAQLPGKGWLLQQGAEPLGTAKREPGEIVLAIGPEGDFTPEERERLLGFGLYPAALGPHTLRVETAAISGLAVLSELSLRAGSAEPRG